ncbi:S-adenosyl-L-methionine-dependent methyltransferase [Irpex rosettiformis]|uniref:S-adenosyl-L-methionine-dependent methyltransferase n=1 Tax=Irpex rosettiformis TaxID=378272 RepID=A0ACB8TS11_9APHY|nr:S-adenosyl-L-methionine-dependent methyltransferase [Irpex rosettiformis]
MSSSFTSLQELRELVKLVNTSFTGIEKACATQKTDLPALNGTFSWQTEGILNDPEVEKASSVITAAASQLAAAVRSPMLSLFAVANQYFLSVSLGISLKTHIPEILREVGSKGLHINEIAARGQSGINPDKLGRILRLLATNHIFREVMPDTFANNRVSGSMDCGKNVKDIIADPDSKYDGTASAAAMLELSTVDGTVSFADISKMLFDPKYANSGKPNETAFNIATGSDLPFFEWLSEPAQAVNNKKWATAMNSFDQFTAQDVILKGFDWEALPKGSTVVDFAGGVGGQAMILAKEFDHLNFVVQDRAPIIENDATKFWKEKFPEAISSDRVKLQSHDIFSPQPVKNAAVFVVRAITHDWSDEYCIKFLKQLRAAATSNTQLVVIDNVIAYACPDSQETLDIPGAAQVRPVSPTPLLPNFGTASAMTYLLDISLLAGLNGKERTVAQFADIYQKSGWKLVSVHADGFNYHDIKTIAVPV